MGFEYTPSSFMLPTSHYDEAKADRAVRFIQNLCHTKGRWAGKPFLLLPWQEQIVRDIFGIVRADGDDGGCFTGQGVACRTAGQAGKAQ